MLPIERPGKIVCVGLNYRDHAEEQGVDLPAEPLLFAKWPNALIGPGEPIVIPPVVTKCDYEAELGVVIGATVARVSKENALEAVRGYICANDVTARDLQFGDGQWTRGKSVDTFCPVGPQLVPAADVSDPHALRIRAIVSGEVLQDSTTANLIFGIDEIISHVSRTAVLEPGDLILDRDACGRRRVPRAAAAPAARRRGDDRDRGDRLAHEPRRRRPLSGGEVRCARELRHDRRARRALRAADYLPDRGLATALFLSLALEKPVLLEGEAGVGKTEAAKALTTALGARLIRLQCYEGLDVSHAVYEWNYARQLLHIRAAQEGTVTEAELFGPEFLIRRPLLEAIDADEPVVLLIDEVDRADEEFEAFLLEVLSDFQITIPELGTISARRRPTVVLTSNRTRELHDALKRRALFHWIGHPSLEREIGIVRLRVPGVPERLAAEAAAFVRGLRELDLAKPPGSPRRSTGRRRSPPSGGRRSTPRSWSGRSAPGAQVSRGHRRCPRRSARRARRRGALLRRAGRPCRAARSSATSSRVSGGSARGRDRGRPGRLVGAVEASGDRRRQDDVYFTLRQRSSAATTSSSSSTAPSPRGSCAAPWCRRS